MNLFNMFLLSVSALFNLWFYFKTPGKIDFCSVKSSAFLIERNLSFSQQNQFVFSKGIMLPFNAIEKESRGSFAVTENEWQFQHSYLIFTITLALIAIGLEIILAKNIRLLKRNNRSLLGHHQVMVQQHSALQHAFIALEESMEENSKRLQVIAHDLRSPIAAIVGLSSFMIDEQNLAHEDMEVMNLIHNSGVDSIKFINEILDEETSRLEMRKEAVDLHLLLTYCIAQLKYKANEKAQEIQLESNISIQLKLSREKIWRVISNLISNALKFSPHKTTISIALKVIDEKAIISIKDQGIGIPDHLSDKIFGLSNQRKREGTNGEKSFGVGLAIAKQNVEAHGGTLSFVSHVGKGTTFFIELPLLG